MAPSRSVLALFRLSVVASCASLAVLASLSFPSNACFLSSDALVYATSFFFLLASSIFFSRAALASASCAAATALVTSSGFCAFVTWSKNGFLAFSSRLVSALMVFVASCLAASKVWVIELRFTTCVFIPGTLMNNFPLSSFTFALSTAARMVASSTELSPASFIALTNGSLYKSRIALLSASVNEPFCEITTLFFGTLTVMSFTKVAIA